MDFLTMDKIFVLYNFRMVLDKKYFVRADGRGIRAKFFYASSICLDKIFFVHSNIEIVQDKNFVHGSKISFLLLKVIQIDYNSLILQL